MMSMLEAYGGAKAPSASAASPIPLLQRPPATPRNGNTLHLPPSASTSTHSGSPPHLPRLPLAEMAERQRLQFPFNPPQPPQPHQQQQYQQQQGQGQGHQPHAQHGAFFSHPTTVVPAASASALTEQHQQKLFVAPQQQQQQPLSSSSAQSSSRAPLMGAPPGTATAAGPSPSHPMPTSDAHTNNGALPSPSSSASAAHPLATPTPRSKHELLSAARDKLRIVRGEERDVSTQYCAAVEGRDAARRALADGVPSLAERVERARAAVAAICAATQQQQQQQQSGPNANKQAQTAAVSVVAPPPPPAAIAAALAAQLSTLEKHCQRLEADAAELLTLEQTTLVPLEAKVRSAEQRYAQWQRIGSRREAELSAARAAIQKLLQEIKRVEEWMREWTFDSAFIALASPSPSDGYQHSNTSAHDAAALNNSSGANGAMPPPLPLGKYAAAGARHMAQQEHLRPQTLAAALCLTAPPNAASASSWQQQQHLTADKDRGANSPSSEGDANAIRKAEALAALASIEQQAAPLRAFVAEPTNAAALQTATLREEAASNAQLLKGYALRISALEKERRKRPRRAEVGARLLMAKAQADHLRAEYHRQREELALLMNTNNTGGTVSPSAAMMAGGGGSMVESDFGGGDDGTRSGGGGSASPSSPPLLHGSVAAIVASGGSAAASTANDDALAASAAAARHSRVSSTADGRLLIANNIGTAIDHIVAAQSAYGSARPPNAGGGSSSYFGDVGGDHQSPVSPLGGSATAKIEGFGSSIVGGPPFVSPVSMVSRGHTPSTTKANNGGFNSLGSTSDGGGIGTAVSNTSTNRLEVRCREVQYTLADLQSRLLPELRRQHGELRGAVYDASVLVPEAWEAEERRHQIHLSALAAEAADLRASVEARAAEIAALQAVVQTRAAAASSRAASSSSASVAAVGALLGAGGRVAGALGGLFGRRRGDAAAAAPHQQQQPRPTVSGVLHEEELPSVLRAAKPQVAPAQEAAVASVERSAVEASAPPQAETPTRAIQFPPAAGGDDAADATETQTVEPTAVGATDVANSSNPNHPPRAPSSSRRHLAPAEVVRDRVNGVEVAVPGDDEEVLLLDDATLYADVDEEEEAASGNTLDTSAAVSTATGSEGLFGASVARVQFYEVSAANAAANASLVLDAVQSRAHRAAMLAAMGMGMGGYDEGDAAESKANANAFDRTPNHHAAAASAAEAEGGKSTGGVGRRAPLLRPFLAAMSPAAGSAWASARRSLQRGDSQRLVVICDAPRPAANSNNFIIGAATTTSHKDGLTKGASAAGAGAGDAGGALAAGEGAILKVMLAPPQLKRLPRGYGAAAGAPPPAPSALPSTIALAKRQAAATQHPPNASGVSLTSASASAALSLPRDVSVNGGGDLSTAQTVPENNAAADDDGFILVGASSITEMPSSAPAQQLQQQQIVAAAAVPPPAARTSLFSRVLSLPAAALSLPYSGLHGALKQYVAPPSNSSRARAEVRQAVAERAAAAAALATAAAVDGSAGVGSYGHTAAEDVSLVMAQHSDAAADIF